jgi:M6 family metalloprotease-like protein
MFGQVDFKYQCRIPENPQTGYNTVPAFGPSGTLRMLIVLCKFADDQYDKSPDTDLWPHSLQTMPSWGTTLLSPNVSAYYNNPSLSGYFYANSHGHLNVIGDVIFYVPKHEESYYYASKGRGTGYLSKEILTSIDSIVDYSRYDNWDPNDIDGDERKDEPDGQVDMILIAFRTACSDSLDGTHYNGISALAGASYSFDGDEQLILDGVKIKAPAIGSGIFCNGVIDPNSGLGVMAHEMGHYLFGTVHFEGLGVHGLMDGSVTGIVSSYEAAKLNWVSPVPITSSCSSVEVPDYLESGTVFKISKSESEYFLIDNHQKKNFYESSMITIGGNCLAPGTGVIISHCTNYGVDIESAFGRWNWETWEANNMSFYKFPFKRTTTERHYGEDKLDLRDKDVDYDFNQNKYITKNDSDCLGSKEDYYNIGYNQVFSPTSNPASNADDLSGDNVGAELVSQNQSTGSIYCDFYITNLSNISPPKTQNLKVYYNNNLKPVLTWEKNYGSVNAYEVYRAKIHAGTTPTYSCVATLLGYSTISWTDPETIIGDTNNRVCYKIIARNSANKESVASDSAFVNYCSSTITSNTTLHGSIFFDGDIIVNSGAKLSLDTDANVSFPVTPFLMNVYGSLELKSNITIPSTATLLIASTATSAGKLYIDSNKTLTIHGTFCIQGSSTQKVTIDRAGNVGFWTIAYDSSYNVPTASYTNSISWANIKHGYFIEILRSDAAISDCSIDSCWNGIFMEIRHLKLSEMILDPSIALFTVSVQPTRSYIITISIKSQDIVVTAIVLAFT